MGVAQAGRAFRYQRLCENSYDCIGETFTTVIGQERTIPILESGHYNSTRWILPKNFSVADEAP